MTKKKSKKIKKTPTRCRHVWVFETHSDFRDGTYSVCSKCGATKFQGDRYSYGSR